MCFLKRKFRPEYRTRVIGTNGTERRSSVARRDLRRDQVAKPAPSWRLPLAWLNAALDWRLMLW
jgi:hypothetical protein